MNIKQKEILTEQDLQEFLGVSRTTLWKLRKNGNLPYGKVGREYRYLKNEVIEWLKESRLREVQQSFKFRKT